MPVKRHEFCVTFRLYMRAKDEATAIEFGREIALTTLATASGIPGYKLAVTGHSVDVEDLDQQS